ncbi:MAG: Asp-tRNA(Asn)/Glu-tRNA(Gln) amidotransferase subunit GatA [Burkholderiaceae bacterium]
MHRHTVRQLADALADKSVSSVELTRMYLDRMAAHADLNAFIDIHAEVSLAHAHAADARIANGDAALLTGVPIAHKDIFATRDFRSTAGSHMLEHYTSPFDATVVEKLAAEGVVTLGKANCDEFAMGSSNEHSYFGPVKNPWDMRAIPGGTSGGSAAIVAARLAPAATGTDAGGSIRQPAAMCGVTGLKPTYGRVSRWGMIAFASSLDQGGPLAQTAEDCALLLNHMAGFDTKDSTSVERPAEDFTRHIAAPPLAGLRIGLPKEFFGGDTAPDVEAAVRAALAEYEKLGATLVDLSLPRTELSIPAYYVIAPAEASSNLSRFDGVRYGHRAAEYRNLESMYKNTRAEGFGWEVKRRILIGAYVLSHGYYDAYYIQAQKLRRLIADDFQRAFKGSDGSGCDVIMAPVAPTVAWNIGEKTDDPIAEYLADIFTLSTSLAGLPGMSIPCGFGGQHRPVGLQIIGNYFDEARMLGIAHRFQQATDWHARIPEGYA